MLNKGLTGVGNLVDKKKPDREHVGFKFVTVMIKESEHLFLTVLIILKIKNISRHDCIAV